MPSILEPDESSNTRPPRPETGTGSGGVTHLSTIGRPMYYFESDFLSAPHW